jgi:hypothetical protein
VPSLWRAGDEPDHPRAIETGNSVRADVHSARVTDRFSVEQHSDGCVP